MLVAPPNIECEKLRTVIKGFSPVPMQELPFKSILIASTNDEYMNIDQAEVLANHWKSTFVNIGNKGHINANSNLMNWPEGRAYLSALIY